jgi:hypothetical protein
MNEPINHHHQPFRMFSLPDLPFNDSFLCFEHDVSLLPLAVVFAVIFGVHHASTDDSSGLLCAPKRRRLTSTQKAKQLFGISFFNQCHFCDTNLIQHNTASNLEFSVSSICLAVFISQVETVEFR